jgi:hypothetical protein
MYSHLQISTYSTAILQKDENHSQDVDKYLKSKPGCRRRVSRAVLRDETRVPLRSVFSKQILRSRIAGSDSGNSMMMLNSWSMCVLAKVSNIKCSSLPLKPSIHSEYVFLQFSEKTNLNQPKTFLSNHYKTSTHFVGPYFMYILKKIFKVLLISYFVPRPYESIKFFFNVWEEYYIIYRRCRIERS